MMIQTGTTGIQVLIKTIYYVICVIKLDKNN